MGLLKTVLFFTAIIAVVITVGLVAGMWIFSVTHPPVATPTPAPTPTSTPREAEATGPVSPAPTSAYVQPTATPTPVPGTFVPTPVPTSTPTPIVSGAAMDWGSDKSTYRRGESATGWAYVENTGNVPITRIDFTLTIKRTILFVPVTKTFQYAATGLNIAPGEKKQVAFSQTIPSDYEGISTAGDYKLTVTATLDGKQIGTTERDIRIV